MQYVNIYFTGLCVWANSSIKQGQQSWSWLLVGTNCSASAWVCSCKHCMEPWGNKVKMFISFNFSYALLVSLLKYFICRLLTAGDILQMWRYADAVKFNIGETSETSNTWECIWRVRPASSVVYLAFSADGTLFATAGKNDRLVRIWYQNQQLLLPSQGVEQISSNSVNYSFIYVAHPRPVTGRNRNGIFWYQTYLRIH